MAAPMVSTFYKRYSVQLLWLVALSFPFFTYLAETIPSNNNVETWLPQESDVRVTYNEFRSHFGAEELIFIGLETATVDDRLIEALCQRIEHLPAIRKCWSPDRLRTVMRDLQVSDEAIENRIRGLSISEDGQMIGLAVLLSEEGLRNREGAVQDVRDQLEYCQLPDSDTHLAGSPVVVAELDRLGGAESNKLFFIVTLLICLCLLYYTLREWKLALSILGLTIWAINVTTGIIHLAGGEMNFILDALSVMVMVFTLAMAVHFLHYYSTSLDGPDPLDQALRLAWKPCALATLTTTIGLISLTLSEIGPVSQFGYAASAGSIIALITGLGLTPAVLMVCPIKDLSMDRGHMPLTQIGNRIFKNSQTVAFGTLGLVLLACFGLFRLESRIDPLDFLPKDSKVLADINHIQKELTNTDSIEAIVDFENKDLTFIEKLDQVRQLEQTIHNHPSVKHTMSLATFFPSEMPENPLEAAQVLKKAQARQNDNDYIAEGQRYWRISARIDAAEISAQQKTLDELTAATAGSPITFTGIAPLLEQAQQEIFRGFKDSFSMAFGVITVVMIIALWSFKAALIAMIPNLTPICIVFGTLGWAGFPLDIGIMMTGSIALGIAVDGTFHYLLCYQKQYSSTGDSQQATRIALWKTGPPILQAAIISSIGMLALTLSSFGPTARFGYIMATMLLAAVIGDLVLLPSLLYLRPGKRQIVRKHPHFAQRSHGKRSRTRGRTSLPAKRIIT